MVRCEEEMKKHDSDEMMMDMNAALSRLKVISE
jgi:hypothetical protein